MNFLDRFRRKPPEIRVLDLLDKHLAQCVASSDHLLLAMETKLKGNIDESRRHIATVAQSEGNADRIRREIINELAEGILPPLNKEDMMELVYQLDEVADWSKEAGRILDIIDMSLVPEILRTHLSEQTKLANQCTQSLKRVVKYLYTDHEKALEECNQVEALEHEMDDKYIEILNGIYTEAPEPRLIFMLKELAQTIEMIGDSCEDTADLIRVVVVSTFN